MKKSKPRMGDVARSKVQDPNKIYEVQLPPEILARDANAQCYAFRNITMLVHKQSAFVNASFYHPNSYPTFDEIRVLVDHILPGKNLFIPVNLHTTDSHMITAIELPGEVKSVPVPEVIDEENTQEIE